MKKFLFISLFFAFCSLVTSCQQELPESVENYSARKMNENPNEGGINKVPIENDNPTPTY